MFLEVSNNVARDYPDIQHENMIIDNCCMQLGTVSAIALNSE